MNDYHLCFFSTNHLCGNDVSIHEFALCTLLVMFNPGSYFHAPKKRKKKSTVYSTFKTLNLFIAPLVCQPVFLLLLSRKILALACFLVQFFCQYHLFASSAQRVNKAQSYNSKVGWPYAAQCSCLIGSRRVTDSCRRVPIGFVRFPNEVTWRSNGRRLDLLT